MQVVVKKSVLFNFLKKALKESRSDYTFYSDGSFLGRFEEEEENEFKPNINSDVPLRANPTMSVQLQTDNFDVSDPEYIPASKSGLISSAAAILDHIPDRQIEFAYEELHRLLDRVMEKEDEINYGELSEVLVNLKESIVNAEELFKKAALLYSQGKDIRDIVLQIDSLGLSMDRGSIEDKIGDMAIEIMMAAQQPAQQQSSTLQQTQSVQQPKEKNTQSANRPIRRKVLRRPKEKLENLPAATLPEDLSWKQKQEYDKAVNKEEFMLGYNIGADHANNGEQIEDLSSKSNDYSTGYNIGYDEFNEEDTRVGGELPDLDDDSGYSSILDKRGVFDHLDIPETLKLIPDFFMLTQTIGYKLEKDRYNLMMAGDSVKDADKNVRQIYNLAHTESFIIHNMTKAFFTKDYALRSAKKHLKIIMDGTFKSKEANEFKRKFIDAIAADKYDEEKGSKLLIDAFVAKILDDVASYDYEPDVDIKLDSILMTNFAATTVYKTGTAAGPGGTQRSTAKPYQGNTSLTFHRRVKEEYREEIIKDFLDRLTDKYLSGTIYKIPSGRKDPNNPKRLEYYEIDPIEMKDRATEYANSQIDTAIKNQADEKAGKKIDDLLDDEPDDILGDEQSPESMSDEEIAKKLSNTKDFQTLAPFFGFSGAPGMRQWFLKFAKRFFEMGIISARSGDRTLIKFHSEMVEAVLETLSENLPELLIQLVDSPDAKTQENEELIHVLSRSAEQIQDAYQEFLDVGDNLNSIFVDARTIEGNTVSMPFLDTLGGQLTRVINGMFFKKVLTKLDKSWTDYVAEQLQTNEQLKNYISNNIAKSANIDAKVAKSVAEYFIGKKNPPEIVYNKVAKQHVYKSEALGNPTKGVKSLLKYGIDANAYRIIHQESQDWFEDMLMTDFARISDFEGQYRVMILKDYEKLKKNKKEFKKVVLKGLSDVIVGSSERMALTNLQDYEVDA